jgi:hypothetical protein
MSASKLVWQQRVKGEQNQVDRGPLIDMSGQLVS